VSVLDWIFAAFRPLPVPKYPLLSTLLPESGERRCNVFGVGMNLDLSDLIQRRIFIGCCERPESTRKAKARGIIHSGWH
jgi:hypothetical protein